MTAVALVQMPAVIGMTYDQSALAAGDGRGYFALIAARAAVQTSAFLLGAHFAGLGGALLGQGVAAALVHPLIIRLARRHGVWDLRHDLAMAALVLLLVGLVVTGEGSLDRQTLLGKTPAGVAKAARAHGIPVVAVCGRSLLAAEDVAASGIAKVYALTELEPDPAVCMGEADRLLRELSAHMANEWLIRLGEL